MKYRKKPIVTEAVLWDGYEGGEADAFFTDEEHRKHVAIDFSCPEGFESHTVDCDCGEDDPLPLLIRTHKRIWPLEVTDA